MAGCTAQASTASVAFTLPRAGSFENRAKTRYASSV
jgi:hypothetical protein